MQTILGAGGVIGVELAKALPEYTTDIRLVSRNPKKVNKTDNLFSADLTDPRQVDEAVKGSEIVYVTIGFQYDAKVWRKVWVPFIRSVIEACKKHNARLVFFDNVYMYDPDYMGNMTEDTPYRPVSKKGEIRKEVAETIMKAVDEGMMTALIARSADFLAPTNSIPVETIYKNYRKGKAADWIGRTDKIHNFTWAEDAGKGTAMLGNTPDAYNQVWHLPSIHEKLTAKEWAKLFAREMNVEPKIREVPMWLTGVLGWFMPIMRELKEMAYQNNRDYFFNSSKFEERFGYKPVKAEEAIRKLVQQLENAK
ncbi:MAG: NAD(P)H-binding protein [Bacteroidales bacterium]